MTKFLILTAAYLLCVATTLSFPAINGESEESKAIQQGHQAMAAMLEDDNPEIFTMGEDVGRADFSKVRDLLNFTAYLEGRPANQSSINFIPLITILSNLNG